MTVKELITILQSYPENMIVSGDCGLLEKEDIKVIKEYCNGDGANPYCEILDEVLYIE